MDPTISDHVTTFVLTKTAGRNCFRLKKPFRTSGVSQQCKYYLQWKIIGKQAFTILCRAELPRGAFLGEMVIGHKNEGYKTLSQERIVITFVEIADKVEKGCVQSYILKVVNTFLYFFQKVGVF